MTALAEMALIARVVKTGEMSPTLEFGITVDDFLSAETKALWQMLFFYYMNPITQGSVLDEDVVRQSFPSFVIPDDRWRYMTTLALCHEVRKNRIRLVSAYAAGEYAKNVLAVGAEGMDITSAMNVLSMQMSALTALGVGGNTDIEMHQSVDNYLAKAELMRSGVDFSIMRWPWEALQHATMGVQKEDYVVFYGRPKSMKTWVLTYLLASAFEQEKNVLVYTKEMTPDQIFLRIACCICRLPYEEARMARLTFEQEQALRYVRDLNADPFYRGRITCLNAKNAPPGGDTVSWLHGKIDKHKPTLIFIDGLYLLSDEASKKASRDDVRVMNISRALRAMNLATGVPIIATMQANRKAAGHSQANLDEIAYSDALSQDATLLARTIADKTSPTLSCVIAGSREFKLHGFRINAIPAVDFTFHSILTEKDIEKAKEQDAEEAETKKAAKKAGANGVKRPGANGASQNDAVIAQQVANIGTA